MSRTIFLIVFCAWKVLFSPADAFGQRLSEQQVQAITSAIPELIRQKYVFKDKGAYYAKAFQRLLEKKRYLRISDRDSLAAALSGDLKELTHDGHMYVKTKPMDGKPEAENWLEMEKRSEIKNNFGFKEIQVFGDSVGYIRISKFMHPGRSMPTAVAAMKMVENTKSLIIDLRGNGGGYPGIMEYILNHFFAGEPTLLSTTSFGDGTAAITNCSNETIYGKNRAGTPLYILTDRKTASAAEYFAYTLQAFKKAVVVGERSAGAAHMNDFFDLPEGFRLSVSVAAPLISATGSNWEAVGVSPDYETEPEQAKDKAIMLSRKN